MTCLNAFAVLARGWCCLSFLLPKTLILETENTLTLFGVGEKLKCTGPLYGRVYNVPSSEHHKLSVSVSGFHGQHGRLSEVHVP